jgi:26S proteasome regulatory subunit N2
LVDEDNFPEKQLAASVASKVFYQLDEQDDALRLCLEAGERFNIETDSNYVNTLVYRAMDIYIKKRQANTDRGEDLEVDPKLESIINHKFEQCFKDSKFKHAMGIALETRRVDMVYAAIDKSQNAEKMLSYTFSLAQDTIKNQKFRTEIFKVILDVYQRVREGKDHDYYKIVKC